MLIKIYLEQVQISLVMHKVMYLVMLNILVKQVMLFLILQDKGIHKDKVLVLVVIINFLDPQKKNRNTKAN